MRTPVGVFVEPEIAPHDPALDGFEALAEDPECAQMRYEGALRDRLPLDPARDVAIDGRPRRRSPAIWAFSR